MIKKKILNIFEKVQAFLNFLKNHLIIWAPNNYKIRYIYGYFSRFWVDFDQIKFILQLKSHVLSNSTLGFALPHKKNLMCSALSTKTKLPL